MSDGAGSRVEIIIKGLEIYAHHGLLPQEREEGQVFFFDLDLTLSSCPACKSDDIEGTVDYAQVADCVEEVSAGRNYNLLERLASVVAETVLGRFPDIESVKVTVAKSKPPMAHPAGSVAVSAERSRHSPRRGL